MPGLGLFSLFRFCPFNKAILLCFWGCEMVGVHLERMEVFDRRLDGGEFDRIVIELLAGQVLHQSLNILFVIEAKAIGVA